MITRDSYHVSENLHHMGVNCRVVSQKGSAQCQCQYMCCAVQNIQSTWRNWEEDSVTTNEDGDSNLRPSIHKKDTKRDIIHFSSRNFLLNSNFTVKWKEVTPSVSSPEEMNKYWISYWVHYSSEISLFSSMSHLRHDIFLVFVRDLISW